jgi:hypothetical protein
MRTSIAFALLAVPAVGRGNSEPSAEAAAPHPAWERIDAFFKKELK